MLEKPINQFSAFLPAFEFTPTLARFIFLLPARFSPTWQHPNPTDNFGIIKEFCWPSIPTAEFGLNNRLGIIWFDTVNPVSFIDKKFCQICAVLAGNFCNQCDFQTRINWAGKNRLLRSACSKLVFLKPCFLTHYHKPKAFRFATKTVQATWKQRNIECTRCRPTARLY